MSLKKSELLLPGGNLKKVKTAFLYGADSVYVGTPDMSLRSKSEFSLEDLKEVSRIAKANNKKFYLTLNLFTHNRDIERLPQFVQTIGDINPDGLLIADPGLFAYFKKHLPKVPLHVSTQANVCSSLTVDFWGEQGASLVVLAREVTYGELVEIKENAGHVKIEAFVHGSMCMTYSGRCLLSNFMSERGANQGSCSHSCRWNYKVKVKLKDDKLFELNVNEDNKDLFEFVLEEEFRPDQFFPIEEDGMGSYILNSKDLCLLPVLPDYLKIGVDTLKIEGRNKSEYYAAITARAYRGAIDSYYENPETWNAKPYMDELETISNRGYTLAFHNGRLSNLAHQYDVTKTLSQYAFAGTVEKYEVINGEEFMIFEIRNFLNTGDVIEFISPYYLEPVRVRLYEFYDIDSKTIKPKISPGRANQCIRIPLSAFSQLTAEQIKEFLPPLSVARKEWHNGVYEQHLTHNTVSFNVEKGDASSSVLDNIKEKIAITRTETTLDQKSKKDYTQINTCCGRGCNGCLVFWNDPQYAKLRDKLKDKKPGEMLLKNKINF